MGASAPTIFFLVTTNQACPEPGEGKEKLMHNLFLEMVLNKFRGTRTQNRRAFLVDIRLPSIAPYPIDTC
jgi:hypothetical protein